MLERRWDGDTRGYGVGSAAALADDVQRLVAEMSAPDWVAEQPEAHLLPHLRAATERPGSPLRLVRATTAADGAYDVDLAWSGAADAPSERREAIFALIGAVSEPSTHVRARGNDEYEVTLGV